MADSDASSVDNVIELREKMAEKFLMLTDGDYKIAKNLEIGSYNATILFADEKGFIKKWENPVFRNSYIHRCISVFTNVDSGSYIKNDKLMERIKTGEVRAYQVGSFETI